MDHRLSGLSAYDQRVIASDQPVLYLPLYGTNTGLLDQSGRGHNGASVGGYSQTTFLNGDGATAFNGVGQYVEVADHDDLSVPTTGILTIEAWMRPDVLTFNPYFNSGYIHWMGKGNNLSGSNGTNEYMSRMYNQTTTDNPPRPNRISGYAFNTTGGLGAGSFFQDTVVAGQWIYYVLVINTLDTSKYNGGYTKVYKNGVARDQDSLLDVYNVVPQNSTNPFRIGTAEAQCFFQGAMCKVAIYNYELPAATILQHYRLIVPPVTGSASFIKNVGNATSSTSGTTVDVTVPDAGVSAGSTLIAKAGHEFTASAPTMADSRGNTYSRDRTSPDSGNLIRTSIFSAQINSALIGGDTIRLTIPTAVNNKALSVDEFSGIIFSSPLDGTVNEGNGSTTTPGTNTAVTTTQADDLLYGLNGVNGPSSDSYTEDVLGEFNGLTRVGTTSGTNDITLNSAYKSVASTASYKYRPTLGTAHNWSAFMAAYKAGTPVVTPPTAGSAQFVQNVGSATSQSSGTTLTITVPTGGIPQGHTLIVRVLGDYTTSTSITVADAHNTYNRDRTAGNAGTTIRGAIFSAIVANALNAGDTITITWPVAITTRVAVVDEFSNVLNPTAVDVVNGATGTSTNPSVSSGTSTQADDLLIGFVGVEGPTDETFGQDVINQWSGLTRVGTTGGTPTSNRTINGAWRAVNATNNYLYAPSLGTSESWLDFIVAYKAGPPVFTPPPSGTAAFVQNVGSNTTQTTGTTLTISVSATVVVGHTLIVKVLSDYMANGPAITDNKGNTYTRDRQAADAAQTIRLSIYSCPITTQLVSGDTITLTFATSSTSRVAVADEFSGLISPVVTDQQNGKTGISALPSVSTTAATAHANDLLIGAVGVAGDVSDGFTNDFANIWTATTRVGTTGGTATNDRTINSAYRSVPNAASYTYAPTLATSSTWVAFIVPYEAS